MSACTFCQNVVCLVACTQSYVSSHATVKVIIFIQFLTSVLSLILLEIILQFDNLPTKTNFRYWRDLLECIVLSYTLYSFVKLILCSSNSNFVIFLKGLLLVTLLQADGERCDEDQLNRCMQRVVPVLSRRSCAGGIVKLPGC